MKFTYIITALCINFILGCSKEDGGSTPQPEPLPELAVTLQGPATDWLVPESSVVFDWEVSGLIEDNTILYTLHLGLSEDALEAVEDSITSTSLDYHKLLTYGNTYYWKISADDDKGRSAESPIRNFSTIEESGSFVDARDGQEYRWVQIGDQRWMAENLRYMSAESLSPEDDETHVNLHGRYYGPEEMYVVCPEGWRLPFDEDWDQLIAFVGKEGQYEGYGRYGVLVKSTSGWDDDYNGTNASGFNAFPSGAWYFTSGYSELGEQTFFWSGTLHPDDRRSIYGLIKYSTKFWVIQTLYMNINYRKHCIRCIAD